MGGEKPWNPFVKKSPAYQRYPKDFMSDGVVLRMTFEERGIYNWLLDSCWLEDGIPDDVAEIARICGLSKVKMSKAWARIAPCFIPHPRKPGWLTNTRLEQERESQEEFRQSMSDAGRRGAAKRWGGQKPGHPPGGGQAIERPMASGMASDSSAVRSSQSPGSSTSTPGRGSDVEKSGGAPTTGELLELAQGTCGLNRWNSDERKRSGSILLAWLAEGKTPSQVEAAIRGSRLMVDTGQVSWLERGKPFGLRALRNTGTLFDQGDGKAARPFFDVAEETYVRSLARAPGKRGGGPTAIGQLVERQVGEIAGEDPSGGAAA